MIGLLLQTAGEQAANPPTIQAWHVVALLGSIALVVLGAYGTLIVQNRNSTRSMRQRMFGAEGDDTDDGFVQNTEDRLDGIEKDMEQHARQTHTQLYKLDQKMDVVLDVVSDEHEDIRVPRSVEDVEDVPPPPGDFYRGGGSPNAHHQPPGEDRPGPPGASDD
ncbi:hypothetical protein M201_gp61 [Haloarcula californiae tailed virus 2]|uniref:Uncharacterized protein n=1 Tax=Haloarcula californiae tailed virus 2 TaxID=1273747 RepID=R4TA64_9CAUD|nr:hypothetical protein M201_gp61 [Haloarcula californiae tailed virus 2]AGM11830.1 hypothetical protein HCTV2_61 [Haloarcula californiae tailed virus 2]